MLKLAISGKANSGKNTLSVLLQKAIEDQLNKNDINIFSIAFADPIKNILLEMFPTADKKCVFGSSALRSEIIPNAFKNGCPLTYRQALQDIGMLARSYNENIWVEKFFNNVKKMCEYNPSCIIASDLRFINEMKALKDDGFKTIRIIRDSENKMTHISETQQDLIKDNEFDFVINNNGSLNDLQKEAFNIIKIALY